MDPSMRYPDRLLNSAIEAQQRGDLPTAPADSFRKMQTRSFSCRYATCGSIGIASIAQSSFLVETFTA
jgi:hypothetical protein